MGIKSDKLCLECETPLIGRIDKKFCNDMCRNSYNNLLNKDANEYVRKVNVILRKNRRILSSLMNGSEKGKATKEQLLLMVLIFIIIPIFTKPNSVRNTSVITNGVI